VSKGGTWRELNAVELAEWYSAIHPDAYVVKGRDSHLLRRFLDEGEATPTQVLEGMLYRRYGSVPIFLHESPSWLLDSVLVQEAELAVFLGDGDPPRCYLDYRDLADTGVAHTAIAQTWDAARRELEAWVEATLTQPAKSPHHPAIRRKLLARQERVTA